MSKLSIEETISKVVGYKSTKIYTWDELYQCMREFGLQVEQKVYNEAYNRGRNAGIDWAAENARLKRVPFGDSPHPSYLDIDRDSILEGKTK